MASDYVGFNPVPGLLASGCVICAPESLLLFAGHALFWCPFPRCAVGAIAGGVAGVVVFVLLSGLLVGYFWRKQAQRREQGRPGTSLSYSQISLLLYSYIFCFPSSL